MCKIKDKIILFITTFVLSFCIVNNSYAITAAGALSYEGIDVSNWQGYIDYSGVVSSGIEVVYIKASQGSDIKDPYFDLNYENAKAAGLKVGFYHFLTATTADEAVTEANFFASVISGKTPDCKLVLDYEVFGGVGEDEINLIAQTFMDTVKNLTGKDVILYSDLSNAQSTFNSELAANYELWLAFYGDYNNLTDVQANWNNYIGVQYTDTGEVSGINGNVDRDLYTEYIFLDEENVSQIQSTGNMTTNYNTKTVYYTVQSGNTLSGIAEEYGTTAEQLGQINGIANINLIYPR